MYLIGFTVDNHILKKSTNLQKIGGINFNLGYKIISHSDGDIILHAISESLLGASGLGDLGIYFSDRDSKNKNIDSKLILDYVLNLINDKYLINNIDLTVVCDDILFFNIRNEILNNLKKIIPCKIINLKFTRFEDNRNNYIRCYSNCLLIDKNHSKNNE